MLQLPQSTKVALGLTVYNGEHYLPYALQSILDQRYSDFSVVVLDDCSSDGSYDLIRSYAAKDHRIMAFRSAERRGLISAWVKVFRLCQRHCPKHHYFGWCSDHDILRRDWLGPLVNVLDDHDDVVLAYPRTLHIDKKGHLQPRRGRPTLFDTGNIPDPLTRFGLVNRNMVGAGNMIYGLFRSDVLDRVGVYRSTVMPDRLVMIEISLHGQIHQVRQVSRLRRDTTPASIQRQRRSLFIPGRPYRALTLPWYLLHALLFLRVYLEPRNRPPGFGVGKIAWMSCAILLWQFNAEMRKKRQRALKHVRGFIKRRVGGIIRNDPSLHRMARLLKKMTINRAW
jgi:glycosyltransferase involved in cell wall biosynthesis